MTRASKSRIHQLCQSKCIDTIVQLPDRCNFSNRIVLSSCIKLLQACSLSWFIDKAHPSKVQDIGISFCAIHELASHWCCIGVLSSRWPHSKTNQNGETERQITLQNATSASHVTSEAGSQASDQLCLTPEKNARKMD